jgi:hypothetical protein
MMMTTLGALSGAACAPDQSVNRAPSVEIRPPAEDASAADRPAIDPPGGGVRGGADAAPPSGPLDPLPPDTRPPPPVDARAPAPTPTPPSPDAAAPGGERLVVTRGTPGAAVTSLTAEGTLDWLHVGFQGTDALNRKRGVGSPLLLMSALGASPLPRSSPDFSKFVWDDGTPVSSARNVQSGFETATAVGTGFQISVQGDPGRARLVKLYVGSQQGRAKLTARFGSFGKAAYVDRLAADDLERNRLYSITFQPANAERALILEWTIDSDMGNVRLQAVTLSEAAPLPPLDAGR